MKIASNLCATANNELYGCHASSVAGGVLSLTRNEFTYLCMLVSNIKWPMKVGNKLATF